MARWEYRRIETLIPYKEPEWRPASKLPPLKASDSTWVTCGKLGKHLLSSVDSAEERMGLAMDAYRRIYGHDSAELVVVDASALDGLEASCVRGIGGDPMVFRNVESNELVVVPESKAKKRYLGSHGWHWTGRSSREEANVTCFKLRVAVGALALVDSLPEGELGRLVGEAQERYLLESLDQVAALKSTWIREGDGMYRDPTSDGLTSYRALNLDYEERRLNKRLDWIRRLEGSPDLMSKELMEAIGCMVRESKRYGAFEDPSRLGEALVALEERLWGEEMNRDLNRAYDDRVSAAHLATVWVDKKDINPDHIYAAQTGFIGRSFSHVEIDDDVDLAEYAQLQREFLRRFSSREIPQVDPSTLEMRFRKCGKHRAFGLYSPSMRIVVVDPRHPISLLHEFAHAYDYAHGQLSCSPDFARIITKAAGAYAMCDMSSAMFRYAVTPTEVFARSWEVYASVRGLGGSFVMTPEEYASNELYEPIVSDAEAICSYFDAIIPEAERPIPIDATDRGIVEEAARQALEAVAPEELHEPDFLSDGDGIGIDEEMWVAARSGKQFSLFDAVGFGGEER